MRDRPMDQRCYQGRGERFGLVPNGREKLGNLLQGHDQWNQYAGNRRGNLGNRPQGYDQGYQQCNRDQNMGINSIKVSPLTFKDESDPEAYLIWESSYERIFQVNDITDISKSCYAIDHCKGYDNTWWDYAKNFRNALNNGKPPLWDALKGLMR
ncbi:hypothetical protein T459_33458 [Capsicum annuum]|uniref:Retrotransposon gag domain-containing protein n=1 Tax=Capsicum annuum TaxID=4072 RepID=A0A2G2XYX1_CAPAN|nr:hypothetical protein T459_33458 [Capsicum annuum]